MVGDLTSTELAYNSLHAIQIFSLVFQIVELSFVAEPPSISLEVAHTVILPSDANGPFSNGGQK